MSEEKELYNSLVSARTAALYFYPHYHSVLSRRLETLIEIAL